MKKKDFDQIKTKDAESLKKLIWEKEKEKAKAHLELKMAKLKNVHTAHQLKKDIARVKTIASEKLFQEGARKNAPN